MARKNDVSTNIDKIAGSRIHKLRIASGLSRKQLANEIDVTHQQLQKYEFGSNRISLGRMYLIAKAFGKPIDYFIDDVGADSEKMPSEHQRMAIEVSRNFMMMKSKNNQYAVNQLVRILAENKD